MGSDSPMLTEDDLPELPASWKWSRVGDLVDPDRGICYGIVQPGKHDPSGVPMVNSNDVLNGRVAPEIEFRVSEQLHSKFRRSTIRGGELLLTLVGANFGRVAIAPERLAGYNCSRAVGIFPVAENADYVMYCLRSPLTRHYLDTWANTTAQPTFNLKEAANLPVPIAPPAEQKAIAHILGTLDNKIELNRRMNATLEGMAQALFKSWFVDFDPVIDNALAAGNPIPDELAPRAEIRKKALASNQTSPSAEASKKARFPAAFEFTEELGWIPKGWEVGCVSNLAALNPESWTAKNHPDSVTYVDLANTKDGRINETTSYEFGEAPSRARRVLKQHDTIIGTVRPGNRSFAYIHEDGLTGSTGFAVLRANEVASRSFIYLGLTRDEIIEVFAHLADGAAYPAIRPEVVGNTQITIPSSTVLQLFEDHAAPLIAKVGEYQKEAETLSKLRDTLLPKLISGELIIPADSINPSSKMRLPSISI